MDELNTAIAIEVNALNNEIMQDYKLSRRQRFDSFEKAALRPLPPQRYVFTEYLALAPVPNHYTVPIHQHFYSVSHTLIGKRLCARLNVDHIEILHERTVVVRHTTHREIGGRTILDEHRTPPHLAKSKRDPDGLITWAKEQGGAILIFFEFHYEKSQPYIAMNKPQRLKDLVHKHGSAVVHRACRAALEIQAVTITDVIRLLSEKS